MRTPMLLEVPKDSPSRKQRLEAWKKAHGIWTHYAGSNWGETPWIAMKLQRGEQRHPERVIAEECRLLDEAGRLTEGKTEREAILNLCRNLDIPCIL